MAVHELPAVHGQSLGFNPSPRPPSEPEGLALDQVFQILRRRLRLIVAVVAAGTALAAVVGKAMTTTYTATAAVVIDATDASFMELLENRSPDGVAPNRLATEMELIKSRSHLERVMRELDLFDDPAYQPEGAAQANLQIDLPEPLRTVASWLPETWLVQVGVAEEAAPSDEVAPAPTSTVAAIDRFRLQLEVAQQELAEVINISFTSSDPEQAARVANGVADTYVASQVEYKREMARRAAGWLEERLDELQQAVQTAEREAAQYQAQEQLAASPDGSTFTQQRLLDLNSQLNTLRVQRGEAESKLRQARAVEGTEDGVQVLADVLNSPMLASLRSEQVTLERRLAEMAQEFGSRHPQRVAVEGELNDVRENIRLAAGRALRTLQDEVSVLSNREQLLREEISGLQQTMGQDQQAAVRLRELERQAEANRALYEMFLRQFKEAQQRVDMMVPDARVISRAPLPQMASSPGPLVFAMVGFTVSLMFGPLLALLMERLDRRVHNAEAIERGFGITVLGLLPWVQKRRLRDRPAAYINERPFSSFAEAARSIITSVRMPGGTAATPVLMVTSALPGEGKTSLSISLAAAAARSGLKTLLIDLDLRRPSLDERLGQSEALLGIVDYINGKLPRADLVRHDPESGIDFVPVGDPPHNPLELLQSSELRHLLKIWRREYDQIIIDSAPILAVTDTKVAARLVDRVVIAVRWRRTDIDAVGHAIRALLEMGAEIAGCVLTAVNMGKYKLYASGEAGAYYRRYRRYYLE